MTKEISFSCNYLKLTTLTLENRIKKKYYENESLSKPVRNALLEFMQTIEDEKLELILSLYLEKDKVDAITLDSVEELDRIIFYIMNTTKFKNLVLNNQKNGQSGLGVLDLSRNSFHSCDMGEHWHTIRSLIKDSYDRLYGAFKMFQYDKTLKEFEGIKKEELEQFILSNFLLIGESKELSDYL